MKKFVKLFVLIMTLTCLMVNFSVSYAYMEDENISDNTAVFEGFDSTYYRELNVQYMKAVQSGDQERQEELIQIADDLLDAYISGNNSNGIMPLSSGTYNDYFEYSKWYADDRGDAPENEYYLSVMPKSNSMWQEPNGAENAWNRLYYMHGQSSHWYNTASMEKQFLCHAHFAGGWKTPWNLEPWRTNVNPFTCR